MLVDKHFKFEDSDIERLKRYCIHRGDMNFIVSQALKRFLDKLEQDAEIKELETKEARKEISEDESKRVL